MASVPIGSENIEAEGGCFHRSDFRILFTGTINSVSTDEQYIVYLQEEMNDNLILSIRWSPLDAAR